MTARTIAIDAVGINGGGGRQVSRDIITACATHPGIASTVVFTADSGLADLIEGLPGLTTVIVRDRGLPWRAWWWTRGFSARIRTLGGAKSLHLANVALSRNPSGSAVMIHQPNALDLPAELDISARTRVRYLLLRSLVRRSCVVADLAIVQTDAVKNSLVKCTADRRCCDIMVAPPGVPTDIPRRLHSPDSGDVEPMVLYVGSDSGHKNLSLLMDAAPHIRALVPGARVVLTVNRSDGAKAPPHGVELVGPQDRNGVISLLSSATVLVMPSLAETVGLPMLEAMVSDVPVLVADRPYAHAICGDAARFFDPLDVRSLVRECTEILLNAEVRETLVTRGRTRVSQFQSNPGDSMIAGWMAS